MTFTGEKPALRRSCVNSKLSLAKGQTALTSLRLTQGAFDPGVHQRDGMLGRAPRSSNSSSGQYMVHRSLKCERWTAGDSRRPSPTTC